MHAHMSARNNIFRALTHEYKSRAQNVQKLSHTLRYNNSTYSVYIFARSTEFIKYVRAYMPHILICSESQQNSDHLILY